MKSRQQGQVNKTTSGRNTRLEIPSCRQKNGQKKSPAKISAKFIHAGIKEQDGTSRSSHETVRYNLGQRARTQQEEESDPIKEVA